MTGSRENGSGPPNSVTYSEELMDYICQEIACGRGLSEICKNDPNMPERMNVMKWVYKYPDALLKYSLAQKFRAESFADEILDIADDSSKDIVTRVNEKGKSYQMVDLDHINRARLRVDSRKWLMTAFNRSKFGDKVAVGGDPTAPPVRHAIEFVITDPAEPEDSGSPKA